MGTENLYNTLMSELEEQLMGMQRLQSEMVRRK